MPRIVALIITIAIVAAVYAQVDVAQFGAAFARVDPLWMTAGFVMFVPLIAALSWRLCILAAAEGRLGLGQASKLILMSSTLNLVLPSKLGDLAKAYAIADMGLMRGAPAFSLAVFEKSLDLAALLLVCAVALLSANIGTDLHLPLSIAVAGATVVCAIMLSSRRIADHLFAVLVRIAPARFAGKLERLRTAWRDLLTWFWRNRPRALFVIGLSVALWVGHMTQIWLFARALAPDVPFDETLARAPLAVLCGLLPITIAGIGTRDAAIVYFFAPFMAIPGAAALAVLCTVRYLFPGLAGLPFLSAYLPAVRRLRDRRREPEDA
ncbi:MAG: lysylphosphatidylglycerol synthase transmembrane domain-containing protein [Alphaproteobacteria bacterium]|nr:lysylphosphatidylglycerol synthase transmembrane domain-containing protein [Alphaproteobacteria bacterium]